MFSSAYRSINLSTNQLTNQLVNYSAHFWWVGFKKMPRDEKQVLKELLPSDKLQITTNSLSAKTDDKNFITRLSLKDVS